MRKMRKVLIPFFLLLSSMWAIAGAKNAGGSDPVAGTPSAIPPTPGVQHAEQFSGADWCAQIVAAQAALPPSGGVIDARSLPAGMCAGGLTLGTLTKPVYLELGRGTYAVQRTVTISSGSQIHGLGSLGAGAFPTYIAATGKFPSNTPLVQFDPANVCFGCVLQNVGLTCSSVAGCTGIDMGLSQENTLEIGRAHV